MNANGTDAEISLRTRAAPATGGPGRWEPLTCRDLNAAGVAAISRLMEQSGDRHFIRDPVWLAESGVGRKEPYRSEPALFFLLRYEDTLLGYAPFRRSIRMLRFAVGGWIFYRYWMPSLTHDCDVELITAENERQETIAALFDLLAKRINYERAIFLDGVPVGGALHAVAERAARRDWIVIPLGDSYEHHFAELPPSFSEYERQLGSRSRKSLRYSKKKLAEHVDGALRTRCFTRAEEVPEFLAAAQAVSRKTYQWKLLGLGLQDAARLTAELQRSAEHGWLRSYLLYCREVPVAFMIGYVYNCVYHYLDVGYDPDWAKWSVGSVLHMEVMEDLLSGETPPDRFDFSIGSGPHKARFGNSSRKEINLLLLRRGILSRCLVAAYAATAIVDKGAAAAAEAVNLKTRMKKWLRRRY